LFYRKIHCTVKEREKKYRRCGASVVFIIQVVTDGLSASYQSGPANTVLSEKKKSH
jgi:hypothetical protein